ncbi:MAG: SPOR domain-containing protein [Ignavibacteriales bacterium]|nr:MAG: SPOR domain-containing protein [Ignavibacteriales bacterium]
MESESKDTSNALTVEMNKSELSGYIDATFDISKYRAVIKIDSGFVSTSTPEGKHQDIWYSYEQDEKIETDSVSVTKTRGYRVEVLATDDLEEANQIKSEIYFITNQKQVYVSFEPPFYKVKVGDYIKISDANNLQFKLNQMGYSESRVISDEVNIFQ